MEELIKAYEQETGKQARRYSYDFRLLYTADFVEWAVDWNTEPPRENGRYLVKWENGYIEIATFANNIWFGEYAKELANEYGTPRERLNPPCWKRI